MAPPSPQHGTTTRMLCCTVSSSSPRIIPVPADSLVSRGGMQCWNRTMPSSPGQLHAPGSEEVQSPGLQLRSPGLGGMLRFRRRGSVEEAVASPGMRSPGLGFLRSPFRRRASMEEAELEEEEEADSSKRKPNPQWQQYGSTGYLEQTLSRGFLRKGASNAKWGRRKIRFFVLVPRALLYYLLEHNRAWSSVKARGIIDLDQDSTASMSSNGRLTLCAKRGGQPYTVKLWASSKESTKQWLAHIQAAIDSQRPSPLRHAKLARLEAPVDLPDLEQMKHLYGQTSVINSPGVMAGGGGGGDSTQDIGSLINTTSISGVDIFAGASCRTASETAALGASFMLPNTIGSMRGNSGTSGGGSTYGSSGKAFHTAAGYGTTMEGTGSIIDEVGGGGVHLDTMDILYGSIREADT